MAVGRICPPPFFYAAVALPVAHEQLLGFYSFIDYPVCWRAIRKVDKLRTERDPVCPVTGFVASPPFAMACGQLFRRGLKPCRDFLVP